jgi:hypothetical protein
MKEPDYDALPVKEADRLIQEKIEHHRDQMQYWALRRGQRLQRELDAGRKPAQIAVDIDTSAQVVYDLTRKARKAAAEQAGTQTDSQ